MAITETRPDTVVENPVNPWGTGEEYPTFARALGSGDHKTLGRFYVAFALLFGLAAWVLMALHTADQVTDLDIVSTDAVARVFSLGRVSLVLLFALPLFIGIATFVVPLQVGSATIAFPRAAAAAFWGWLTGAVMLLVAYAVRGGIGGTRSNAVSLGYLAMGLVIVALLLATVCLVTTIVTLRAPGMRMDRLPLFSWSMFVAGSIWLLSLPVLLANLLLIYVDFHFGRPSDFGVGPNQLAQLFWVFQQPQVFVFAIPVVGIVSDIVATMSGSRVRNRGTMFIGIAAFGILSFGAYVQPFYNPGVWTQWLFVGQSILLLLPLLLLVGGWATTMRAGKPRLNTPAIGALGATLVLVTAALASALFAIEPLRLQPGATADSTPYFQFGVLVLVIGAATAAGIAGLHYWAPKMWGRMGQDMLGKLAALLAIFGSIVGGLALCVNAFQARFDGLRDASDALNGVAAAGIGLLVVAVLVTIVSLLGRGGTAADDPWAGQTLEWVTTSPPPPANFAEQLAVVASAEPLLDPTEGPKEDNA
jgi:cytochrome c oxidase subunit I